MKQVPELPELTRAQRREIAAAGDAVLKPAALNNREIGLLVRDALTAEDCWRDQTERCFAAYAVAGAALAAKKEEVGHGNWLAWLEKNRPARYRHSWNETGGTWGWTARRWMRIAHILQHAHPEALESAQTVAQLFRLAAFTPEGGGADPDTEPDELLPLQIVTRVSRWVAHAAPMLTVEKVSAWSEADRTRLREQLAPMKVIIDALG